MAWPQVHTGGKTNPLGVSGSHCRSLNVLGRLGENLKLPPLNSRLSPCQPVQLLTAQIILGQQQVGAKLRLVQAFQGTAPTAGPWLDLGQDPAAVLGAHRRARRQTGHGTDASQHGWGCGFAPGDTEGQCLTIALRSGEAWAWYDGSVPESWPCNCWDPT